MPKVYVTNKGAHDYSAAERFGDLIFLTEGLTNPFDVSKLARIISDKLEGSAPTDWLLITGLTITNIIAALVFGQLHGKVNLLLFHGKGYKQRNIDLKNLKKEKKDDNGIATT